MIYRLLITILILLGVQSMKNGRQAGTGEFPFVVSIQHWLFHLCSGTIIDKYHILTIAHVVVSHSPCELRVVPGRPVMKWAYDKILRVQNIYLHPNYTELILNSLDQIDQYWENDIAILRLINPFEISSLIGPISLSTMKFESYRCFECTMISWNYKNESNPRTMILMWDIVYIVDDNRCEQWGTQVLANQQCFIDLFETAFISTEDLGSPIICEDSLVGLIVKTTRDGEATSPATCLSTLNYIEFISETINSGVMNAQTGEFPYVVSIWHAKKHTCGGIIVNTEQVITAGQCIRNTYKRYLAKSFKVAAGSNEVSLLDDSIQWYPVKDMKVHIHYLRNRHVHDSSSWLEHAIGLITVSIPFSWSPTVQRLRLADVDDFSTTQLCQILHWTRKEKSYRRVHRILTKITAVLVDNESVMLKEYQIAAKEPYSVNSLEPTDIGNPIICGGHAFGIMVKTNSIDVKSQAPLIIFLRIHAYASMNLFSVELNSYLSFTLQRKDEMEPFYRRSVRMFYSQSTTDSTA